jgi:hypothetical protein
VTAELDPINLEFPNSSRGINGPLKGAGRTGNSDARLLRPALAEPEACSDAGRLSLHLRKERPEQPNLRRKRRLFRSAKARQLTEWCQQWHKAHQPREATAILQHDRAIAEGGLIQSCQLFVALDSPIHPGTALSPVLVVAAILIGPTDCSKQLMTDVQVFPDAVGRIS